ncbi:MAG: hypothetical protein U9N34_07425, partial [Candidatus Cloacimonadota bacterium]|nr:hypothetical protein [Candidatus Cloacimonadota bacterium]
MKKYFTIIILTILAANAFAYSLMERYKGNDTGIFDARTVALGQAGVACSEDVFGALNNPATLSDIKSPFGITLTPSITTNSDNRSFPMFNFFDGYIDNATYVSNTNLYDEYAAGAFYTYRNYMNTFSAGLLSYSYLNFESHYQEQVRNDENSDYDNYPPVVANNQINSEGSIKALSGILSYNFNNVFSVGLQFAKLSGDVTSDYRITWTDEADELSNGILEDTIIEEENSFSGNF